MLKKTPVRQRNQDIRTWIGTWTGAPLGLEGNALLKFREASDQYSEELDAYLRRTGEDHPLKKYWEALVARLDDPPNFFIEYATGAFAVRFRSCFSLVGSTQWRACDHEIQNAASRARARDEGAETHAAAPSEHLLRPAVPPIKRPAPFPDPTSDHRGRHALGA
jgi:hypothetical protein